MLARLCCSGPADVDVSHQRLARGAERVVYEPDWLLFGRARRARNAGEREREGGMEALARAVGELSRHFCADSAVALEHLRVDPELFDFDLVGVADDAAEQVVARRMRGEQRADQAARAGLRQAGARRIEAMMQDGKALQS